MLPAGKFPHDAQQCRENISVPEYVQYTMVCSGTMVINGEHEFQSISE